jgi:hypothetical protein
LGFARPPRDRVAFFQEHTHCIRSISFVWVEALPPNNTTPPGPPLCALLSTWPYRTSRKPPEMAMWQLRWLQAQHIVATRR